MYVSKRSRWLKSCVFTICGVVGWLVWVKFLAQYQFNYAVTCKYLPLAIRSDDSLNNMTWMTRYQLKNNEIFREND